MQKHIPAQKVRMVRKQVYITAEQDRLLKERALAEGVAAAEIIRRGLQHAIEQVDEATQLADWKASLRTGNPIWVDRDDMQEWLRDLRRGWGRRAKRLGLDSGDPQ